MKTTLKPTPTDIRYLNAAFRLARKHEGQTGTNPSVGCLVVAQVNGCPTIVGSAVTSQSGRPHAEPVALDQAGEYAKGATVYVTLEPCSHYGKTPPCAETLVSAGIKRLVCASADPDHRVSGKGYEILKNNGIEVVELADDTAPDPTLRGYFMARLNSRPLVTLKLAMTNDGVMGSNSVGNVKITGNIANRQTHLMRARHHAILVGSGTLFSDDPMLSCRLPGLADRSPKRVVLSSNRSMQASSRIAASASQIKTYWAVPEPMFEIAKQLEADTSVQAISLKQKDGAVDLGEFLNQLHDQHIYTLMVEGGAQIAQSFLEAGLVDVIVLHQGGDPQLPSDNKEAVISPITLDRLPKGFKLCQEHSFGKDRSYRFERVST